MTELVRWEREREEVLKVAINHAFVIFSSRGAQSAADVMYIKLFFCCPTVQYLELISAQLLLLTWKSGYLLKPQSRSGTIKGGAVKSLEKLQIMQLTRLQEKHNSTKITRVLASDYFLCDCVSHAVSNCFCSHHPSRRPSAEQAERVVVVGFPIPYLKSAAQIVDAGTQIRETRENRSLDKCDMLKEQF